MIDVLKHLRVVLESGHAYNGIADDNAMIYAKALREVLGENPKEEKSDFLPWDRIVGIGINSGMTVDNDCNWIFKDDDSLNKFAHTLVKYYFSRLAEDGGLANDLWSAAQVIYGDQVNDGVMRVRDVLRRACE